MNNYILLLITAILISIISIKMLQRFASKIGLLDQPCNRKHHKGHVPLIGGISIYIAVLITSFVCLPITQELRSYLIASGIIVFIGALDDKYDLGIIVRILGQVLVALVLINEGNSYISNFGDLFNLGDVDIGSVGYIFTFLAVVVVINAFNMIDGMDGLLGMQSLVTLGSIALLLFLNNNLSTFNYALVIIVAMLPYMFFNLGFGQGDAKRIHMGDAGSMFIGLSVVWLLSKGSQGESIAFSPVTALWITAVPLLDMLATVIRRVNSGRSPFKPDREHIHHIFLKLGLSNHKTLTYISLFSIFMSFIGVMGQVLEIKEYIMFSLFLVVFVLYFKVLVKIKALANH